MEKITKEEKDRADFLIRRELDFLKERGFELNENDQFIYHSENGYHRINLPFILREFLHYVYEAENDFNI